MLCCDTGGAEEHDPSVDKIHVEGSEQSHLVGFTDISDTSCRAAITNMRGVKRFLARGRLEGPHTPPDASTAATWLKARVHLLWPSLRLSVVTRPDDGIS